MIELYDFKLIKSGKEIEVYSYKTKKMLRGYERKERQEQKSEEKKAQEEKETIEWAEMVEEWGDDEEKIKLHTEQATTQEEQTQKTKFSISRTRTNIRRLTNSNPHLNQFLTLTFGRSMPNLEPANKLFNQAIKRIVWKHPYFQYIAVNEFQKDTDYHGNIKPEGGSVHYHLLCNLGPKDTSKEKLFEWERRFAAKYWQNGFVKIKPVQQVTNMGAYFCKYLGKDMFDKRMFRKKKYFCSQTLDKPVELIGDKAIRFFNQYVKSIQPVFEKTFSSEYAGTVDYSAYSLGENVPVNEVAGKYDRAGRVQKIAGANGRQHERRGN